MIGSGTSANRYLLYKVCAPAHQAKNDDALLTRTLMHWWQLRTTVNRWSWLGRFVVVCWYSFVFDSGPKLTQEGPIQERLE